MQDDLVRLLRFMQAQPCRLTPSPKEGEISLRHPASPSRMFPLAVIDRAQAEGLIVRSGETIRATLLSRPFLRRAAAERDDAFLDQHRVVEKRIVVEEGEGRPVTVNLATSPLATLARLKGRNGALWFDADSLAAGERLARDFAFANLQPRVTMSYAPHLSSRKGAGATNRSDPTDDVMAARERVNRAMTALGPELSGIALDVCCFEKGLEVIERERQWPARSAKLMLRTALSQLHRHYQPNRAGDRARTHRWGAEGYRPDL